MPASAQKKKPVVAEEPDVLKPLVRFRNGVARALQVTNQYDFDLVIGHDVPALEALTWLQRRFGFAAWLDCVETPQLRERSGDGYRVRPDAEIDYAQNYVDERIRGLDGMITVGPTIAAFLRQDYELPIAVVRNFRNLADHPDNHWIRLERSAQKRDRILVANPTVFKPSYEPEVPLEMLAALPEEFEMIHFGNIDARYGTRAHSGAQRLGLESRTEFFGRVPYSMYPAFLGVCDIGLSWLPRTHANLQMAFPNRLSDFLAAGLPFVSSSTPDVASFVEEHGIGVVAESDDAAGLAAAARALVADLPRYRDAVNRVREEFTWEREMETLLAALPPLQRVLVLTQKPPDYQARTEKMARSLAARGVEVLYVSSRYKEIDAPGVKSLAAV